MQTRLTSCRPHSVEYENYPLPNIIKIALDNRLWFEGTPRRDHRCGRTRALSNAHAPFHLRGTEYVITFFFFFFFLTKVHNIFGVTQARFPVRRAGAGEQD